MKFEICMVAKFFLSKNIDYMIMRDERKIWYFYRIYIRLKLSHIF